MGDGLFSLDGPIYKFGNMIADVVILSLLWIVCSIPIVTIGASTTAIFYVTTKRVSNHEGYLFKEFFTSFKTNLKQSTLSWLLLFTTNTLMLISFFITLNMIEPSYQTIRLIMIPIQLFVIVEVLLVNLYIFPIISRFELGFRDAFKTAFFMANKHILSSIACIFIGLLCLIIIYLTGIFVLVAIGVYAYLTSYLFARIFKKYRPEMDNTEDWGKD